MGLEVHDNAAVGGFAIFGHLVVMDEEDGVSTFVAGADTLGRASRPSSLAKERFHKMRVASSLAMRSLY